MLLVDLGSDGTSPSRIDVHRFASYCVDVEGSRSAIGALAESFAEAKDPLNLIQIMLVQG